MAATRSKRNPKAPMPVPRGVRVGPTRAERPGKAYREQFPPSIAGSRPVNRNTVRLTILAQDPGVRIRGRLALSRVEIPAEIIADGPAGYRVRVIDFDATANRLYLPHHYRFDEAGELIDPWRPPADTATPKQWRAYENRLLSDPQFHCQHTYAIAMRILARFEFALGRRVSWSFGSHQLHVAPHAFRDANAYYSEEDRALFFGYFDVRGRTVFTCLAHDIVAHEVTHALLDGMRSSFSEPSSPDQTAFHEGFSDVVALLSMFSLREIVAAAIAPVTKQVRRDKRGLRLVPANALKPKLLQETILFGLAKELGETLDPLNRNPLRASVKITPSRNLLQQPEYQEPHTRGEILVAAFLQAFLAIWTRRIEELGMFEGKYRNLDLVVDAGAKAADHLLTIAIRALDYCPPTDIDFPDYLAAVLTADAEVAPDDSKYGYREAIRASFAAFGVDPPSARTYEDGTWQGFGGTKLAYGRTHFESMLRDREEVFRFVWENRTALAVDDRGHTDVHFVRRSTRVGPDGFVLHETVCEYVQVIELFAAELKAVMGFERPEGMPTTQRIPIFAGGTLVFDEYGRLKYHIAHPLIDAARQRKRVENLWLAGHFDTEAGTGGQFAELHRQRALV